MPIHRPITISETIQRARLAGFTGGTVARHDLTAAEVGDLSRKPEGPIELLDVYPQGAENTLGYRTRGFRVFEGARYLGTIWRRLLPCPAGEKLKRRAKCDRSCTTCGGFGYADEQQIARGASR